MGPPLAPDLRLNLHFHPDRLSRGQPILTAMAASGVYRSQFETGTSNGGLTAHPGGDRWAWESRLFGGAYDASPAKDRPKYGALNFRQQKAGAAPRFGSAHLRLHAAVLERATFCYPDSVYEPTSFGVAAHMGLTPLAEAANGDPLDGYIEAHVHGLLRFDRDVEAIVLDPSYRGGEVEALARQLPVAVEWHAGFRLETEVLRAHPEYRGPAFVELGEALAEGGALTPRILGDAARSDRYDEQALKRVWHYVARFGANAPTAER